MGATGRLAQDGHQRDQRDQTPSRGATGPARDRSPTSRTTPAPAAEKSTPLSTVTWTAAADQAAQQIPTPFLDVLGDEAQDAEREAERRRDDQHLGPAEGEGVATELDRAALAGEEDLDQVADHGGRRSPTPSTSDRPSSRSRSGAARRPGRRRPRSIARAAPSRLSAALRCRRSWAVSAPRAPGEPSGVAVAQQHRQGQRGDGRPGRGPPSRDIHSMSGATSSGPLLQPQRVAGDGVVGAVPTARKRCAAARRVHSRMRARARAPDRRPDPRSGAACIAGETQRSASAEPLRWLQPTAVPRGRTSGMNSSRSTTSGRRRRRCQE